MEPRGGWGCLLESARFFKEARDASRSPGEASGGRALKTREDAKKREFSRVAQGSASGAKWRKEAQGAQLTDRKLEQKCGVTHFRQRP